MNGIDNQKHSAIIDEIVSPKAAVYRALLPSSTEGRKK
jgi:hypothetical protein